MQRSRPADILDGLTVTYLAGEKYFSSGHYGGADDPGNDQSMYSGVDLDLNRWVIDPPATDALELRTRQFGSAHSGVCFFVMCDGSVQSISTSIDREIHRANGNRMDGVR